MFQIKITFYMCKSILRKKGLVKVSINILQTGDARIMKALFSEFYPISIQYHKFPVIYYVGYSQLFRELQEEEKIPTYEIKLKKYIENNEVKINIHECNEI